MIDGSISILMKKEGAMDIKLLIAKMKLADIYLKN